MKHIYFIVRKSINGDLNISQIYSRILANGLFNDSTVGCKNGMCSSFYVASNEQL